VRRHRRNGETSKPVERRLIEKTMGIHNKTILTERVRKLEEDVKKLSRIVEDDRNSLQWIVTQQDRMLKILETMTDGEAYHKWLEQQNKENEKKKEAESKK
jgi:flagellar biosynthesis component FlhA